MRVAANGVVRHASRNITKRTVSVVIGHPRALASEGLARILSSGGYRVSGRGIEAEGIVDLVAADSPEVVFVDSTFLTPDVSLVKRLVDGRELAVVVLIGESVPETMVTEWFAAGARGCLSFDDDPLQFLSALELLLHGAMVVSPACTRHVFRPLSVSPAGTPEIQLSGREVQVASLIGQGATNEEIAQQLSISVHTVKIHVGSILTKLNLRNRHQVAAYVAHYGLLSDIRLQDPKP